MLELATYMRRELIAAEFGERRNLERRQADARAAVAKLRRAELAAMQRASLQDRREVLRRMADRGEQLHRASVGL